VHKYPIALANAIRAYDEAIRSSVHFLIAEKERMDKELHTPRQGGELVTKSTIVELKRIIMDEVLSLESVMQVFYSMFGTVHKEVFHLNIWQQ